MCQHINYKKPTKAASTALKVLFYQPQFHCYVTRYTRHKRHNYCKTYDSHSYAQTIFMFIQKITVILNIDFNRNKLKMSNEFKYSHLNKSSTSQSLSMN